MTRRNPEGPEDVSIAMVIIIAVALISLIIFLMAVTN